MYEREQYQQLQEKMDKGGALKREVTMIPLIRMLQAAAVIMKELMTSSPQWNRYLEILEGAKQNMQVRLKQIQAQQLSPDIWDPNDLMRLKGDASVLEAQIKLIDNIMKLPHYLIDAGAEGQVVIDDFEKKYANSTDTDKTQ